MQNLKMALEMEVETVKEGYIEGEGTLLELGATGFLMQEAETGGTILLDVCNGFNKLSRLEIL